MRSAITAIALLALTACSDSVATETQDAFGYAERETVGADEDRDLRDTTVPVAGMRGGSAYGEFDDERDASAVDSFQGFGCLESCDGHQAGWDWASENEIADPIDCSGDSWSFVEGCAAYAEKNSEPEQDERPDLSL